MSLRRWVLSLVAALLATPGQADMPSLLRFDDLRGWEADDHAAALSVFPRDLR
jgi:hypothetical protein